MENLYAMLGLTPNATHDDVRAAYRKASKTAHPDAGGTAEAFAEIQLAHDILTDEDLRARYDRTGDCTLRAPEGMQEAQILNYTMSLMDHALRMIGDVEINSLTAVMKDLLSNNRKQAEVDISGHTKQLKRLQMVLKRTTAKKDQPNKLGILLAQQIAVCDANIAQLNANLEIIDGVAKLIDQHDYAVDKPKRREPYGYFDTSTT